MFASIVDTHLTLWNCDSGRTDVVQPLTLVFLMKAEVGINDDFVSGA